jgi:hypothetical protein
VASTFLFATRSSVRSPAVPYCRLRDFWLWLEHCSAWLCCQRQNSAFYTSKARPSGECWFEALSVICTAPQFGLFSCGGSKAANLVNVHIHPFQPGGAVVDAAMGQKTGSPVLLRVEAVQPPFGCQNPRQSRSRERGALCQLR